MGQCEEFTLCISKPEGANLGLDLDSYEDALPQVCGIDKEGAVDAFNCSRGAADSQQIRVGDFILSVNGVGSSRREMLQTIKVVHGDIEDYNLKQGVPAV